MSFNIVNCEVIISEPNFWNVKCEHNAEEDFLVIMWMYIVLCPCAPVERRLNSMQLKAIRTCYFYFFFSRSKSIICCRTFYCRKK